MQTNPRPSMVNLQFVPIFFTGLMDICIYIYIYAYTYIGLMDIYIYTYNYASWIVFENLAIFSKVPPHTFVQWVRHWILAPGFLLTRTLEAQRLLGAAAILWCQTMLSSKTYTYLYNLTYTYMDYVYIYIYIHSTHTHRCVYIYICVSYLFMH